MPKLVLVLLLEGSQVCGEDNFHLPRILLDDLVGSREILAIGQEPSTAVSAEKHSPAAGRLKGNEEICNKLIPEFEVGCRRVRPGHGYLEALIEPNLTGAFDGIKLINETGVLDNNNFQHDLDVIICATAFDVSHRPALPVLGRGSQDLKDFWNQG
ncbi:monooxygenase [Fusarium bulbicola]|nr:monooxygenase [Fusarium bulbicola]